MRAVIFDFFGTLTDPGAEADRRAAFVVTADALGVAADRFWAAMSDSFPDRIIGRYGDTRATVLAIARQCGVEPDGRRLDAAVAAQRAGAARVRPPRPAIPVPGPSAPTRTTTAPTTRSTTCPSWPR